MSSRSRELLRLSLPAWPWRVVGVWWCGESPWSSRVPSGPWRTNPIPPRRFVRSCISLAQRWHYPGDPGDGGAVNGASTSRPTVRKSQSALSLRSNNSSSSWLTPGARNDPGRIMSTGNRRAAEPAYRSPYSSSTGSRARLGHFRRGGAKTSTDQQRDIRTRPRRAHRPGLPSGPIRMPSQQDSWWTCRRWPRRSSRRWVGPSFRVMPISANRGETVACICFARPGCTGW